MPAEALKMKIESKSAVAKPDVALLLKPQTAKKPFDTHPLSPTKDIPDQQTHDGTACIPCPNKGDCFLRESLGPNTLQKISLGNLDDPSNPEASPLANAAREALRDGTAKLGKPQEISYKDAAGNEITVTGTVIRVGGKGFDILVNSQEQPTTVEQQAPAAVKATIEAPKVESLVQKATVAPVETSTPEPTTPKLVEQTKPPVKVSSLPVREQKNPVAAIPMETKSHNRTEPVKQKTSPKEQASTKPAASKETPAVQQPRKASFDRHRYAGLVVEHTAPTEGAPKKHIIKVQEKKRGGVIEMNANTDRPKQHVDGLQKIIQKRTPQQRRIELSQTIDITNGKRKGTRAGKLAELVLSAIPSIALVPSRRGETVRKADTISQTTSEQKNRKQRTIEKSEKIKIQERTNTVKRETIVARKVLSFAGEQQKGSIRHIVSQERRAELHARLRLGHETKRTPSTTETRLTPETTRPLILMIPKEVPVEQIAGAITRIAKEKREKIKTPPVEINVSASVFDQLKKIFGEAILTKLEKQTDSITIACEDKRIAIDVEKLQLLEHLFADFETQVLLLQLRQCLMQSEIQEATVLCGCQQQNAATAFEMISFCQGCHQSSFQQAFFWLVTVLWYTIYEMTLDPKQQQMYTQSYSYEQKIFTS